MEDQFENLLLALMESLIGNSPWEDFLKALKVSFGCQNTALFLRTPTEDDTGMLVSQKSGVDEATAIVETFFDSPFLNLPKERVWLLHEEVKRPIFCQEYSRYLKYHKGRDTTDIMALNFLDTNTGIAFYFRLVRYSHKEHFQTEQVELMRRLIPYIKRAVAIYSRLLSQQQHIFVSDHTTTSLGIGYLVVAADRTLQLSNSVAAAMIKEQRGITVKGNKLSCTNPRLNRQLTEKLKAALECVDSEGVVFEVTDPQNTDANFSLVFRLMEVPPELRDEDKQFISVVIYDQREQTVPSEEVIAKQFHLTPAEAQLAKRLATGDSLAEAAEFLGRTKGTVRVQLSSIFSKTGVHKQHQLISLIMQGTSGYSLTR